MLTPCLTCGTPTDNGSRCTEHTKTDQRLTSRAALSVNRSPRRAGYDYAWDKLSARARQLQPFCSDCGATEDLQTDHTPEAWRRKSKGLAIRLEDVDVVCGPCNRARGPARGPDVTRPSERPGLPHVPEYVRAPLTRSRGR